MGINIDGARDLVSAADGSLTIEGQSVNTTGIMTASGGIKVGTAATIHSTGQFNIGVAATIFASGNATFAGIVTASEFAVGTSVTIGKTNGNATFAGIVTASAVDLQTGPLNVGTAATISANGNATFSGIVTATSFSGSGANLTGVSAGEFFGNSVGVSTSKNIGIHTTNVNTEHIVGAANSFVGLYMGDGFIGFPTALNRNGGYFIATTVNALSAGPVSLGSTMTLHGTWTIV
tara:strand:- start:2174 stop:2875 length:702 start_codon:yes stop_codon:yes gene_type:complete